MCEILPHLGFQCSVKTFNDTGIDLLVVSGKEVHFVFFEKRLKYSVGKIQFLCLSVNVSDAAPI